MVNYKIAGLILIDDYFTNTHLYLSLLSNYVNASMGNFVFVFQLTPSFFSN